MYSTNDQQAPTQCVVQLLVCGGKIRLSESDWRPGISVRSCALQAQSYLFVMDNLVQVGLELFGQQHSFKSSSGDASPVKVLHPQSSSQLQLSAMQQISLRYNWRFPIPGSGPAEQKLNYISMGYSWDLSVPQQSPCTAEAYMQDGD